MQQFHQIEEFKKFMNMNKFQGYKRKRLKLDSDSSQDNKEIDLLEKSCKYNICHVNLEIN